MKKPVVYGYARVSTMKQRIERQIQNIREQYPEAVIVTENFTGTKMDRPAWNKMCKQLKQGDVVVFDEVSRMSRNAEEGFQTYQDLYQRGINLVFLKEPYINTDIYRNAAQQRIEATISTGNAATDTFTASILEAVNQLLMDLAKQQISAAFDQAQAEVDHLHQRTSEGVRRAQAAGKQVGRAQGACIVTKKSIATKKLIRKHCRDFGGTLTDKECLELARCSRNSYFKYKKQLRTELDVEGSGTEK